MGCTSQWLRLDAIPGPGEARPRPGPMQRGGKVRKARIDVVDGKAEGGRAPGRPAKGAGVGRPGEDGPRLPREIAQRLRQAEVLFEVTDEGVLVWDAEDRIVAVNPAFTAITGYGLQEVLGEAPRFLRSGRHDEAFYDEMRRTLERTGRWTGEIWIRHKDGEVFLEWLTVLALDGEDGTIEQSIGVLSGVARRRQDDDRLYHLSNFDALTGLPSRQLLEGQLQEAVDAATRHGGGVALICLDLDNLKTINESLGHALGDRILVRVAEVLRSCLGPSHLLARFSGDQFMIVVSGSAGADGARALAEGLLEAVSEPFAIEAHSGDIRLAANAGIALWPNDGAAPGSLIRNAHAAAIHAKRRGRDTYLFFAERLNARAMERLELENKLRRAIDTGELVLHYQPIIDLRRGRPNGVEALVRWRDADGGLIGPANFIPLAEERGLIGALGDWVLRAACAQARQWQEAGLPALRMAINLSPHQLVGDDFTARVEGVLSDTGLAPEFVEFEVTESALMDRVEDVAAKLGRLRELGVRLSIDDFGTGYASLSYLKSFAVDAIKVDASFVADIGKSEEGEKLVSAVVAIGQSLGLTVTAEGVESEAQLVFLRQHWCDQVQGAYFSPPVPADELAKLASWQGRS